MDDRDLLDRAARAARLTLRWSEAPSQGPWIVPAWTRWNPLKDDGDAFRLAVQLGLEVLRPDTQGSVSTARRAIVEAAARPAGEDEHVGGKTGAPGLMVCRDI